jgi:hypothetical protein
MTSFANQIDSNVAGYSRMGDIWNAGIQAVADAIPAPV